MLLFVLRHRGAEPLREYLMSHPELIISSFFQVARVYLLLIASLSFSSNHSLVSLSLVSVLLLSLSQQPQQSDVDIPRLQRDGVAVVAALVRSHPEWLPTTPHVMACLQTTWNDVVRFSCFDFFPLGLNFWVFLCVSENVIAK